ncbi:MAG: 6-carboxytetrahydropterin synthase [Planctomycetota bacterium]
MESWSIEIHKDYIKFSAAHFLIFPDGTAERLHGHNYKVFVEVHTELDPHGLVLNFQQIKPLAKQLVDELDEHLLIPGEHPVLRCEPGGDGALEIRYADRRYVIPAEDVVVLPVNNTSAENLAGWLGRELRRRIGEAFPAVELRGLVVGVEETVGQRGVYTWREN